MDGHHHISLYICEKLSRKINKLLKLKEIVRRMGYKEVELNFLQIDEALIINLAEQTWVMYSILYGSRNVHLLI